MEQFFLSTNNILKGGKNPDKSAMPHETYIDGHSGRYYAYWSIYFNR